MSNPLDIHRIAIKRIFRYLLGTLQHGILLKKASNFDIVSFTDSDWAGDKHD